MSRIIGIDLGTTNSCVAVQGSTEKGYEHKKLKGFSVITDSKKRKSTPSVLVYTGDKKAPYNIGHTAKRTLDGKYAPVMFAKRHLGTDKKFPIDDNRSITPDQVSAEILRYLKSMAEDRLGQEVKHAVVTVPAYFSQNQKVLTKKALQEAGFQTDSFECILPEPAAAALTYVQLKKEEQLDKLKIMVYDLGGGTFDITILEKNDDLVEVRAYGGDHALGGYDFDRLLADYMVDELKQNFKLDLDTENSLEDKMIYTKLLLEAEDAKITLSRHEEHPINRPGLFADQNGETVDLDMEIDRDTFNDLISTKVEETIEECKITLKKSPFNIEQIDKIIMVGGSSYIPLIQERLEEEFQKKPELVMPDLCVALGAAINATQLGRINEGKVVNIKFDTFPSTTALDEVPISGKISSISGKPLNNGYTIEVTTQSGSFRESTAINDEAFFYFSVPLQIDTKNICTVKVIDPAGEVDAETDLEITHSSDADEDSGISTEIPLTLSKSLYVKRAAGPDLLVAEGTELPIEEIFEVPIIKKGNTDQNSKDMLYLEIIILEEDMPIGNVNVTDIPVSIENGASVRIGIKVTSDFDIIASAELPTVNRTAKSVFKVTKTAIPTKKELLETLSNLEKEWDSSKLMLNADDIAQWGVKVERTIARAKDCLKGNEPDTTEAAKAITRLKQMLGTLKPPAPLTPTKEQFETLCETVKGLILKAEEKNPSFKCSDALSVVKSQGDEAWEQHDQEKWDIAYKQVEDYGRQAEKIVEPPLPPPDPIQLLLQITVWVKELKKDAEEMKDNPRYPDWIKQIDKIETEIKEISKITDKDEMLAAIRSLYNEKFSPLADEIKPDGKIVIII